MRSTKYKFYRGSVALSAIVALMVGLTLVLGMITIGNSVLLGGKRTANGRGAENMADSGLEWGFWQYLVNKVNLPYSGNRTLGRGKFTVTVTDNSTGVVGSVSVTSVGTWNGTSITKTRVFPRTKTVFDYAMCSNNSLYTNYYILKTGVAAQNGDIRCNGYLQLNATGSVINGDSIATQSAINTIVTGKQYSLAPAISYPTINTTYYAGIADRTFNTNQTWNGFTFNKPYEVVFVNGNITLNAGSISGTGTLVASNTMYITGDLVYADANSKYGALAINGIIPTAQCSVVGFYYCHNASGSAYGNANSNFNFTLTSGSFAADNYYTTASSPNTYTLIHDPAMNPVLGKSLHLPGY